MTSEVIDRSAIRKLLDLIGGDPEDLRELIEEFEKETPQIVASMHGAVSEGDMTTLRIAAHSLKSNSHDMGATALAHLCAELEQACKDGAVSDPAAQVAAIEAQLTLARAALSGLSLHE